MLDSGGFQKLYTLFGLAVNSQLYSDFVLFQYEVNASTSTNDGISFWDSDILSFHQIAVVQHDLLEETIDLVKAQTSEARIFDTLIIFVLSEMEASGSLILSNSSSPCPACIWLFHNEDLLPQNNTNFHLMDKILFPDSDQEVNEIYGIKGQMTIRKKIPMKNIDFSFPITRRINFQGTQVEVAHVWKPNFLAMSGRETLDKFSEDFIYQVLAYAQDMFEFSANFHYTDSWVWASANTTSMADLIIQKKVDIALTETSLFSDHYMYRFLFPTSVSTGIYVYYQSKHLPLRGGIYEGIIGKAVIVCLLGMVGVIVLVFRSFHPKSSESPTMKAIAILTGQGVGKLKIEYKMSTRILTFVGITFQLLCFILLSSHLLSSLSFTKQIKTFQDLTERGILKFGAEKNSVPEMAILKTSRGSIFWDIRTMYKPYESDSLGLSDVLKDQSLAYLTDSDYSDQLKKSELKFCDEMRQLVVHGQIRYGSSFVQRDSEFAEPFNYAALRMAETGLKTAWMKKYSSVEEDSGSTCLKHPMYEPAIHLQDIKLTYYILLAGCLAGFVGVWIEILVGHIRKRMDRTYEHNK